MNNFISEIDTIEKSKRVSLTKKHPALLPMVLGAKRFIKSSKYNLNPKFKNSKIKKQDWFNISEHSSPLYRKFNKRELDEGKIENIRLAIKNLDGLVIQPGEIFSFWKHVGRPSNERGFKKGLVLVDGKMAEDFGGGLCQLSNLLAYLFACTECKFLERKHHSRDVFPDSGRSVPFASGATVFFNLIDLKIKNTYDFPIQINLRTTETQLRGSLSSPNKIDYYIKIEEKENAFIKSERTNDIYRCNKLYRVYYEKNSKNFIKQNLLWTNVAKVVYEESNIKNDIFSLN